MKRLLSVILPVLCISAASVGGIVTLDAVGAIDLLPDTRLEATFYNYDESFLWSTYFEYGDTVTYKGPVPTKKEDEDSKYTFLSWDKSLTDLTESTSFYATFKKESRDYKCVFKNFNGLELYVDFVPSGGTANYYGVAPSRPKNEYNSYRFTGWDKSLDDIRSDTVFTAQFEDIPLQYEVTFLDYNGDVLYVDEVSAGETAKYVGTTPVRPSKNFIDYEFSGWDKDLNNVFSDFSTTALYKEYPVRYHVNFLNYDGTVLYTDYVSNGGTAHYIGSTPYRPADEHYIYVFDTWNRDLKNVHSDMNVTPIFTTKERDYSVVFKDSDGTVLYQTSAIYNSKADYVGPTPTKESDAQYDYEFAGWDRDIEHVKGDLEVYPVFDKILRKYDCHFFNYDGSYITTIPCEYGKTVHYDGETPYRPNSGLSSYTFFGWDKSLENITEETSFTAVFIEDLNESGDPDPLKVVTFYDYSTKPSRKDILDYDVVLEGEIAVFDYRNGYPKHTLDKNGTYTFVSWDKQLWMNSMPAFSFDVYPQFNFTNQYGTKYYIVTYRDNNGDILYEDYVRHGYPSSYDGPEVISITTSSFVGWANYIVYDNDLGMNITQHPYDLSYITESITVYPMHN